jgi:hypothetical protein
MQRGSEKRPNLRTRVRCEPQCRVPYSAFTCSYTTTVPVVAPVHGERRARRTNSGSASTMALKWAPAGPASHGRYSSTLLRETVNHTTGLHAVHTPAELVLARAPCVSVKQFG